MSRASKEKSSRGAAAQIALSGPRNVSESSAPICAVSGEPTLESLSGLRPAAAFLGIAAVLCAVAVQAGYIALYAEGAQPYGMKDELALWPGFDVTDRNGWPLALSVECFDLTLSPQAMWRSHTPSHMAEEVADVLGPHADPAKLLARMLPFDAAGGEILPYLPQLIAFDAATRERVEQWIATGTPDPDDRDATGPIAGMRIERLPAGDYWTIAWRPAVVLSVQSRVTHAERYKRHPELWSRRLLQDLATFIPQGRLPAKLVDEMSKLDKSAARMKLYDAIWAEMMPCRYRVVARTIEPLIAHGLSMMLKAEFVSPFQMKLEQRLDRRHPVRPGGEAKAMSDSAGDAFEILGHWGVLGPNASMDRARSDARLAKNDEYVSGEQREWVAERAERYANDWRPWSGLELLAAAELSDERWSMLETERRRYQRSLRILPRDRKKSWGGSVPNYFREAADASPVPRLESTLDAELQSALHAELGVLMEEKDPALAMGIVVEVETGDVLAVDGLWGYEGVSGFPPIRHQFTPGSTMKAVIMAIALDQGVTYAEDRIQTFAPRGLVVRKLDGTGRGRPIGEALGAPKEAWITARQGLSRSVNAVLVQIGLRVDDAIMRGKLVGLGYGQRPQVGLGPEAAGYMTPLKNGAWTRRYTHASVSFGHEISVSLWQHAAALATIARGGLYRPLRLLRAVEQGEKRWEIETVAGQRVLSEQACATVRSMMATGAESGTGDDVASPEFAPEFWAQGAYIGTKTGTTEKVSTELCLHVELAYNAAHPQAGRAERAAARSAMRGRRDHKSRRTTCYTASMCAVGRLPGDERELLVLIVVEESRCAEKFGAAIAGQAAMNVLRHGFDLDVARAGEDAFAQAPQVDWFNQRDLPWSAQSEQSTDRSEEEGR